MNKLELSKPTLIVLYGFPGAGKTYFARQLAEHIKAAHISSDRVRYELFERPRYDKQEADIIAHLMGYMAEEFLRAGISVIYDYNAARLVERRALRDLARRVHAQHVLIWLQIDPMSAKARLGSRDRRKSDDRYAVPYSDEAFERFSHTMQNPKDEEYVVISGKHAFNTQRGAVIKRLFDLGLIDATSTTNSMVMPGLVNLVPNAAAGRVDLSRRNIVIR